MSSRPEKNHMSNSGDSEADPPAYGVVVESQPHVPTSAKVLRRKRTERRLEVSLRHVSAQTLLESGLDLSSM